MPLCGSVPYLGRVPVAGDPHVESRPPSGPACPAFVVGEATEPSGGATIEDSVGMAEGVIHFKEFYKFTSEKTFGPDLGG